MQTLVIIVFEKQPRWTPELQRQFASEAVDVVGCSTSGDFERRCVNSSVGVVDVDAAPQDCLQLLGRLARTGEFPPIIAIGSEQTAALEWPLREFGVLEFAVDRPTGDHLARLCSRQWSNSHEPGRPRGSASAGN